MRIEESLEYDNFQTITGNRTINQKKVDRLISDIQSGLNLLPYCPVVVYPEGTYWMIVDGQHRYEAAKSLGHPIYYVVCESLSLQDIAKMNSKSDKWTLHDFLQCYLKIGSADYTILENYLQYYKFNFAASCSLLMYGTVNRSALDHFRNGTFNVNFQDKAEGVAKKVLSLFGRYKFFNDKNLIHAVMKLEEFGECDWEILGEKIKSQPNAMDKQLSWKGYAANIEKVYNYRNNKRVAIYN